MQNKKYQLSEIITQRQFSKISLFQKIKQIKGEYIFKFIYQKSKFMNITQQVELIEFKDKKYFVFILKGQILIYKKHFRNKQHQPLKEQSKIIQQKNKFINNKSFIRTYQAHEFFGYQDYPLYWKQQLCIQATQNTQILIFPIQHLYKVFNKVIPLISIQNTAQYLKKLPIFRSVQLQKLFRLSSFCKRIRTYMDTQIFECEQKLQNIMILYDGRVALYNKQGYYQQLQMTSIIGYKQLQQASSNYIFSGKSLAQCDFIVIPLKQYLKVVQIKNQLKQSNMEQSYKKLKFRKVSNSKLQTQQIQLSISNKQQSISIEPQYCGTDFMNRVKGSSFAYSPFLQIYQHHDGKYKMRPSSAVSTYNKSKIRNITYCSNGRQLFVNKTQLNFYKDEVVDNNPKLKQKDNVQLQNVTLGQLCLMKFINRKERLQNKHLQKYIKSKAPQLILNPNKQFGMVKSLQGKNSSYIKNFKRKIKDSNRKGKLIVNGQSLLYQQKFQQQYKKKLSNLKQFQIQKIE